MNNSYKTAITRNKISAPSRWLIQHGFITNNDTVLDYGCGKGYDADTFKWAKYDSYYCPELPPKPIHGWDVVVCNYVLNTVTVDEEIDIMKKILRLGRKVFVSVRRDIPADYEGYTTKSGTFQRWVLTPHRMHSMHRTASMEIFAKNKKTFDF